MSIISKENSKPSLLPLSAGIIAAVLLVLTLFAGGAAAVEIVADTTWYTPEETTYTISTTEELAGLSQIVNGNADGIAADSFAGKTILLSSDIQINSGDKVKNRANTLKNWVPLGTSVFTPFKGNIDGQGHTITGLYSNSNGLICYGEDCTVKNLKIVDSAVITENYLVGMIAGIALGESTFINCQVTNSEIESTSISTGDIGGIAGEIVRGTLSGCSVSNTVIICRNCDYTGGLVGYIDDVSSFNDCTASDIIIISAKSGVGGIAGYAFTDISFTGCSVKSSYIQSVYDNYAGGILGFGGAEAKFSGCSVSSSRVQAYKHSVGGIAGYAYHADLYGTPTTIQNTMIISEAEEYVGGFIGSANRPITVSTDGCQISNSVVVGTIDITSANMGVIVGRGALETNAKMITVTDTILANKANPAQTDKNSFNKAGTTGNENGWIISMNNLETIDGITYGTKEIAFNVPKFDSDLTDKSTKSPFPLASLLAGLGVISVILARTRK